MSFGPSGGGGTSVSGAITSGRKTVSSAGTAETLVATSTPCNEVIITAESDNTGTIAVGGADVVATSGSEKGSILASGESMVLTVNDAQLVYLDASVSGDGVAYNILS